MALDPLRLESTTYQLLRTTTELNQLEEMQQTVVELVWLGHLYTTPEDTFVYATAASSK